MTDAVKDLLASESDAPEAVEQLAKKLVGQAYSRRDELQERTRQLQHDLGPRKFRLLLAACCRHAYHHASRGSWKEQAQAIELLEKLADTGKGKTALREVLGAFKYQWSTRSQPALALYRALSPTEPEKALGPCVNAIQEICDLSDQKAWDLVQRFCDDLAPSSLDVNDFKGDWRRPSVTELARTMYESLDFSEMPRLAEALEQAGCHDQTILDHCHNRQVIHIKGCWLLDVILQDWIATRFSTRKKSDAKSGKRSRKPALLAKVFKRGRDQIARIMEDRDGHLSLEDFLAKRWNIKELQKSTSDRDNRESQRMAKWQSDLAQLHPEWSPDQVDTVISIALTTNELRDVAIARRFTLEDPAELGRGLSVYYRLLRIRDRGQRAVSEVGAFIEACAVRDVAMVQGVVEGARAGYTAIPSDEHLRDIAEIAILQEDFKTLQLATARMRDRKVGPWLQAIYSCLMGVAERKPDLVAGGLESCLTALHKMRHKDELEGAINLVAQGLHRLCEWVSPELVSGFDVTQPFPWDTEFHAWCQDHPDPLEGIDLSGISPVLHEAVVFGRPPEWLTPVPNKQYEIVLHGGDPKSPKVLDLVGTCADGTVREARQLLERCPVVLRWNVPLEYAERVCGNLKDAGASAEVRAMKTTPFPF